MQGTSLGQWHRAVPLQWSRAGAQGSGTLYWHMAQAGTGQWHRSVARANEGWVPRRAFPEVGFEGGISH